VLARQRTCHSRSPSARTQALARRRRGSQHEEDIRISHRQAQTFVGARSRARQPSSALPEPCEQQANNSGTKTVGGASSRAGPGKGVKSKKISDVCRTTCNASRSPRCAHSRDNGHVALSGRSPRACHTVLFSSTRCPTSTSRATQNQRVGGSSSRATTTLATARIDGARSL
jgi:hypothetical protein